MPLDIQQPPKPSGGSESDFGTLVSCAGVSLLVIVLAATILSGLVGGIRAATNVLMTPFNWIGCKVAEPIDRLESAFRYASAGEDELARLQAQNEKLQAQLAELEYYRSENASLNQLVGLSQTYTTEGVAAHVVGLASDTWEHTVTIDRGTNDGILADMPVTDGSGIIGQVASSGPSSSVVRLLSDSDSQVSARVGSNSDSGILCGSTSGYLSLEYIPLSDTVNIGDAVVTSGLGGSYPAGMLLGTVSGVTYDASDMYYHITVEPVSEITNYAVVYVVTSYARE